jgi:hypothetical protein
LLLNINWLLPESKAEPVYSSETQRPVIRISSTEKPPEKVVIDTGPRIMHGL